MVDSHPISTCRKRLIRIALFATYPLLGISALLFVGMMCSVAFVTEFTVENKTAETIAVTPVGTVGKQGHRYPLPVCMWHLLPVDSPQRGGFDIPPGKSVDILYDMDDINFSEIVVHDRDGERGQLVANRNPTQNQYHAPAQTRFVIDDLDSLAPVPDAVRNAAHEAQRPTSLPWIMLAVLLGPWVAFAVLSWLSHSLGATHSSGAIPGP